MGLRRALYRLLDRGQPDPGAADEHIELGIVPQIEGPLLMRALIEQGIDAHGVETFNNTRKGRTDMRVTVPRRDFERANGIWRRMR